MGARAPVASQLGRASSIPAMACDGLDLDSAALRQSAATALQNVSPCSEEILNASAANSAAVSSRPSHWCSMDAYIEANASVIACEDSRACTMDRSYSATAFSG